MTEDNHTWKWKAARRWSWNQSTHYLFLSFILLEMAYSQFFLLEMAIHACMAPAQYDLQLGSCSVTQGIFAFFGSLTQRRLAGELCCALCLVDHKGLCFMYVETQAWCLVACMCSLDAMFGCLVTCAPLVNLTSCAHSELTTHHYIWTTLSMSVQIKKTLQHETCVEQWDEASDQRKFQAINQLLLIWQNSSKWIGTHEYVITVLLGDIDLFVYNHRNNKLTTWKLRETVRWTHS